MTDHQPNLSLNLFPIKKLDDLIRPFIVPPERKISLAKDYDPAYKADHLKKSKAKGQLKEGMEAFMGNFQHIQAIIGDRLPSSKHFSWATTARVSVKRF